MCTKAEELEWIKGQKDDTEQREGVASVAELLCVVHPIDDGTAALPGVREVVCTAWVENKQEKGFREEVQL